MQSRNTLCWSCANACGGCSWSDGTFTPVEGWTAIPAKISAIRGEGREQEIDSFIVTKCPKFKNDRAQYKVNYTDMQYYER